MFVPVHSYEPCTDNISSIVTPTTGAPKKHLQLSTSVLSAEDFARHEPPDQSEGSTPNFDLDLSIPWTLPDPVSAGTAPHLTAGIPFENDVAPAHDILSGSDFLGFDTTLPAYHAPPSYAASGADAYTTGSATFNNSWCFPSHEGFEPLAAPL